MGWRLVRQPDGKLARFSEVVDNFTHYDMTDAEAFEVCLEHMGRRDAEAKIQRANNEPGRYAEAIRIIGRVHGKAEAKKVHAMIRGDDSAR